MPSCSLSPAERAVTDLLVQGLSNQAIADALVLSVRTVESHVSHSLIKTGCTSRLELVVWLLGQQQLQSSKQAGTLPTLPA